MAAVRAVHGDKGAATEDVDRQPVGRGIEGEEEDDEGSIDI
jgi:hypothetical protein